MISTEHKLYGLVLAGGKSTRMGRNKAEISYHGMPQAEYLYNLLNELCTETFMSIRKEQLNDFSNDFKLIEDLNEFRGPFNGILSAHKQFPNVAWLVLACDLPLIDKTALQELISARDISAPATAFALKSNPLPEPLIAIWEADSLKKVTAYLSAGNSTCPRKFLISSATVAERSRSTKLVFPSNENWLINANSVEDYEEALKLLKKDIHK